MMKRVIKFSSFDNVISTGPMFRSFYYHGRVRFGIVALIK